MDLKMFKMMAKQLLSEDTEIFTILDIPVLITEDNGLILQNKPNSSILDGSSIVIGSDTDLFEDDLVETEDSERWYIKYKKGFKAVNINTSEYKKTSELGKYELISHYSGYLDSYLRPKFRLSNEVFRLSDILYKSGNYLITRNFAAEISDDLIQHSAYMSLDGEKLFLNQDGLEIVNGNLGYSKGGQFMEIGEK